MGIQFEEIKKRADIIKGKLFCQSIGHRTMELVERVAGKPPGYVKVSVVCMRCGQVLENPVYEWRKVENQ